MSSFKRRLRLLLFDIDGTLIHADGAGRSAVVDAFEEVFQRPLTVGDYRFDGKTDPVILADLAAMSGISKAHFAALRLPLQMAIYTRMQKTVEKRNIAVLPGVLTMLKELQSMENTHLGLVTGNDIRGAAAKLAVVDLIKFFAIGAYGNDRADRRLLPPLAISRAERHWQRSFAEAAIWIVGDTPNDILAGKANQLRTVAVTTGRFGREDLAEYQPDMLVEHLTSEIFNA
jgi:phosphoglycolate phosphatase